jgi:hypothetical protein
MLPINRRNCLDFHELNGNRKKDKQQRKAANSLQPKHVQEKELARETFAQE